ncbi:hypothetical protein [Dyadobacter sp. 676]|uniref:Uncharacterized protein n=1 Tax=Dyadobacter sp. 676 TaxID=3088362 RepID=A0AAU8FG38_9BACT
MKPKKSTKATMRRLFFIQGCYYIGSGIWPVIHIESFMWVTGEKTDLWLVKMVGLLSCSIGVTLLAATQSPGRVATVLAAGSALAFAAIDIYYTATGVISKIYLADSLVQLVLLAILIVVTQKGKVNRTK